MARSISGPVRPVATRRGASDHLRHVVAAIRELEDRRFIQIVRKRPAIYELTNPDQWKVNCHGKAEHDVTGNRNNVVAETVIMMLQGGICESFSRAAWRRQ
jgi:hypothetical protein